MKPLLALHVQMCCFPPCCFIPHSSLRGRIMWGCVVYRERGEYSLVGCLVFCKSMGCWVFVCFDSLCIILCLPPPPPLSSLLLQSLWNKSGPLVNIWWCLLLIWIPKWGTDCQTITSPACHLSKRSTSSSWVWIVQERPLCCTACASMSLWTLSPLKGLTQRRLKCLLEAAGEQLPSTFGM